MDVSNNIYYRFNQKATGRVLDGNNGGQVYSSSWDGNDFQRWVCIQLDDAYYRIYQKATGRTLDGNNGGEVYSSSWNGNDFQRWAIEWLNNDSCLIINKATKRHLDGNNGGQVYTSGNDLNDFKKWSLVAVGAFPVTTGTVVDNIVRILEQQGPNKYKGVTYMDTSDNKFTLLDTPRLWDQKSSTAPSPIPACEDFLTKIQTMIGKAQSIVDITLLWQTGTGLPGGGFQKAISAGFKALTDTKSKPFVRILVGIPFNRLTYHGPDAPNIDPRIDFMNWLRTTIELNNNQKVSDVAYNIQIAFLRATSSSWNHSKIIATDGIRAIVGGHNLWDKDYLGATPIHDVSGLIEGSSVTCLHGFCDYLWNSGAYQDLVTLSNGKFDTPTRTTQRQIPSTPLASGSGSSRILSLGRLGAGVTNEFTVASNASVSARIVAICMAKEKIRISQQSLYFTVTQFDSGFDFYTLWALVKAIEAGVKVQIVVSNDVSVSDGGYTGNLAKVVESLALLYAADKLGIYHPPANPPRDNLDGWASASLNPPISNVPTTLMSRLLNADCTKSLEELNARLSVAPLYYSPNVNYWQVGSTQKPAGNHAKVYIIDDRLFYVGSDNLYLSGSANGLQEFGHLIESKDETSKFVQKYWDKLWKNSCSHVLKATIPHNRIPISPWPIH